MEIKEKVEAIKTMREEIGADIAARLNDFLDFAEASGIAIHNLYDDDEAIDAFTFENGEICFTFK